MNDQTTTVLYTLTTLAQSCAALAAFVGAVGVFRMQMLRDQRRDAERELRARSEGLTSRDTLVVPFDEVLEAVRNPRDEKHPNVPRAREALKHWKAFEPLQARTRRALLVLEAWNLGVIGVSLIGFNYVPILARAPWFSYALLVVATGTIFIPLWCVWVWTKGVEE